MPLAAGQTLSFYEILGPLGVGGMGEVYRARDTRLEREVAIKVLPEELADDDERLRRFEREAKTLASLNHPNVAGIHGVDQEGDVCFLALELVPGEDLATRLSRRPLPVDESIDVCRQIAEGLEAAHEAGVVHRDLKPANVRITPDGVVKVLDFGLAKPVGAGETAKESDSVLVTSAGKVLGTPAYLSPEQARGGPLDRRTDVWAFGCVLYECLTGRRLFPEASLPDLLAAVVSREPDWSALPASTPAALRELLARCLRKDPRRRMRDIGDARIALEELAEGAPSVAPASTRPRGARLVPLLAATTVVAVAAAVWAWLRPASARSYFVQRPITSTIGWENSPNWSPEAEFLAFGRMTSGSVDIYVQPVAGGEATLRVESPGDDTAPRWSPDGKYLAYVSSAEPGSFIFLVPPHGGRPRKLIATNIPPLDFTTLTRCMGDRPWSADGGSLLVSRTVRTGQVAIHRVERDTGEGEQLTFPPAGSGDFSASFSFDGERIVFERRIHGRGTLWTIPAAGGDPRELLAERFDNMTPAWRPDGRHVVFRSHRGGVNVNLWEIDVGGGVPRQVTFETKSVWAFSVSRDDRIAHAPFWHDTFLFSMEVDTREERQLTSHTGENFGARFSPDGRTVVYHSTRTGDSEIWLHDVDDGSETRLTDHPDADVYADWSPDGEELIFVSNREDAYKIFSMTRDGGNLVRVVDQPIGVPAPNPLNAGLLARWSPDGTRIAYLVAGDDGNALWTVRPDGGDAHEVLENVYGFDWYLDSQHAVCMRQELPGATMVLVAVDLETGRERVLFDKPHAEIDVAPDGRAVAFCAGPAHLGMKPFVLRLEPPSEPGGLPRVVGEPEPLYPLEGRWHVHNGGWSADSSSLVFTRDTDFGDIYELVERR